MCPQDKCKLKAPKEGDSQTNIMSKMTFHWCSHYYMWTVHNKHDYEMIKTGKYKTVDTKTQNEGEKGQVKHFVGSLHTILTNIR